jgi:hypothetical protein
MGGLSRVRIFLRRIEFQPQACYYSKCLFSHLSGDVEFALEICFKRWGERCVLISVSQDEWGWTAVTITIFHWINSKLVMCRVLLHLIFPLACRLREALLHGLLIQQEKEKCWHLISARRYGHCEVAKTSTHVSLATVNLKDMRKCSSTMCLGKEGLKYTSIILTPPGHGAIQ